MAVVTTRKGPGWFLLFRTETDEPAGVPGVLSRAEPGRLELRRRREEKEIATILALIALADD
ncbi:MAG: hypothetical protein A3E01_02670 [Gammaproteobacteria bacterium RIFCSPHIGHO2_12_FULL_63_22]|nr:MAG: hypothetical protein A3E01_02670 [Gammaproteobacteria bacterium RIFCSPHIGHO2_12_FULL_63_22]